MSIAPYDNLNIAVSGLRPGFYYALGGAPRRGKTNLMLRLATLVARNEKVPVLYYSFEQTRRVLLAPVSCHRNHSSTHWSFRRETSGTRLSSSPDSTRESKRPRPTSTTSISSRATVRIRSSISAVSRMASWIPTTPTAAPSSSTTCRRCQQSTRTPACKAGRRSVRPHRTTLHRAAVPHRWPCRRSTRTAAASTARRPKTGPRCSTARAAATSSISRTWPSSSSRTTTTPPNLKRRSPTRCVKAE